MPSMSLQMGSIHQRLEELGQERLLLETASPEERRLAEIAYAVMSDDRGDRAFAHPVMCLTTLPHRGRPSREVWIRTNGPATLTIQPTSDRHGNYFGVPYGSKARLILLFLQTEAVKRGSRQVELGHSMRSWLSRMGVAIGGKNLAEVRAQAKRIERSLISVSFEEASGVVSWQDTIVRGSFQSGSENEIMAVELSETFFNAIKDRPVPVSEAAIRALGEHSLAIDLYLWLAYRLHVLERPISLSWTSLHAQFGGGVNLVKHWKPKFLRSFAAALAAYPTARAELTSHGVRLFPSPPPTGRARLRSVRS
jgi:hypothetical protein